MLREAIPVLHVSSSAAARAFYCDRLGFRQAFAPRPNSTGYFITDGIESAVNQAKTAAAGKSVGVRGADAIQQGLNAGLLDEIQVDIAAVLLGSGIRLFDHLAGTQSFSGTRP